MSTMQNIHPSRASASEFKAALLAMSEADLRRVRKAALLCAAWSGGASTAEDLLQEAVKRTLSGDRKWKRDVTLAVYLKNVMRSIVYHSRLSPSRTNDIRATMVTEDPANADARDGVRDLLQCLEDRDDKDALDVLEYLAAEYSVEETISDLGISRTTYDTILKRIRRIGERMGLRDGRRRRGRHE